MSDRIVRIGTRGSLLARWQANWVAQALRAAWPGMNVEVEVITTQGDVLLNTPLSMAGGKGLFTSEIERALQSGQIDLAVHSLKDLPAEDNLTGLTIGAIPQRANPADVLVSRSGRGLKALPPGARVGTSSPRRAAQLKRARPDLQVVEIRGNVDTRLKKVLGADEGYDAIVLAFAGLERLERLDVLTEILPLDVMLPAPGQAALAVQCRAEAAWLDVLAPLNHPPSLLAVTAERAFLNGLGGGCALPVAAYAEQPDRQLTLRGRVTSPDGSQQVDAQSAMTLSGSDDLLAAQRLGFDLARQVLEQGAGELINSRRTASRHGGGHAG